MPPDNQVTLDQALELARRHHQSGNLVLADRTYRDILNAVPGHYPTVHYLGIVLYQRGNLPEALSLLERAVKIAPKDAQCWSNYAAMLSESHRVDEAIKAWNKAIRLDPTLASAYSSMGNIEWQRGHFKRAEELCRKAIALEPRHTDALLNLGNALASQKKHAEAIKFWQKAVKINPRFSKAWNNWGNALRDLGRIRESYEKCEKALECDPQNPQALNNFANALRDLGRPEEAEAYYRRAVAADPAYADAHNNLAINLIELSRFEDAVTAARYAVSFNPRHAGAYGNLSVALRELGFLHDAESAAQRAVALRPDDPEGYLDLCDALLMSDRFDEAEAAMERAIKLAPNEPRVHLKLGGVLERLLRHDDAIAAIEKAIKLAPENPVVWQRFSTALFMAGDTTRALEAIDKALALKPDFAAGLASKANILQSLGRTKESEKLVRQGLKLNPRNPYLYYSLAQVKKFTSGDADFAAMRALAPTVDKQGFQSAAALHFALFHAYEDTGDARNAFMHLKTANDMRRRATPYDEKIAGQYYKNIRRFYTKSFLKTLAGKGYKSDVPVFIVGMPRSGTTLTEQIIAAHPHAFGAGELHDLSVVEKMFDRPTPENSRKMGKAYVDRIRRHDKDGRALRITDKMPGNFMRIGEILSILPDAKIIHCRRGAVDTLLSCYKQNFARGQYWSYDLTELAQQYRWYLDTMDHWRKVLPPGSFLEIDYEETVGDFENQARRIVDFIGLEWHPACLSPHKQKRAILTASKMQVIKPVYTSSVKGWKKYEKELKPLLSALKALDIPPEFTKSVTKKPVTAKKKAPANKAKRAKKK
jgi:tetratricopeptide (TPR) repeat protein